MAVRRRFICPIIIIRNLLHFIFENVSPRYPEYDFLSDNDISKSAGLAQRYTDLSLRGVVTDIQLLSETDFLVCTFSSQVRYTRIHICVALTLIFEFYKYFGNSRDFDVFTYNIFTRNILH